MGRSSRDTVGPCTNTVWQVSRVIALVAEPIAGQATLDAPLMALLSCQVFDHLHVRFPILYEDASLELRIAQELERVLIIYRPLVFRRHLRTSKQKILDEIGTLQADRDLDWGTFLTLAGRACAHDGLHHVNGRDVMPERACFDQPSVVLVSCQLDVVAFVELNQHLETPTVGTTNAV
jgi:hypothetical protein